MEEVFKEMSKWLFCVKGWGGGTTRYDLVVSLLYLTDSVTGQRGIWEWPGDSRFAPCVGGARAKLGAHESKD